MASRAERSLSFGAIADDFDRLRPDPPADAIDWLLPARRDVVVDLAAGTGKLTRALAGKAQQIIAVEPDERMRAVLAARSADVEVLAGRGEALPLPDASADAILISSAWHWLDPALAVPEIVRVLRDGARLGVLWTGLAPSIEWLHEGDWFREARAERRAAAETSSSSAGTPEAGPAEAGPAGVGLPESQQIRDGEARQVRLPTGAPFRNIETQVFQFTRYLRAVDIADLLATYSGVITASSSAQEAGKARAADAITRMFPGAAELPVPMRSRCWRADREPREHDGGRPG